MDLLNNISFEPKTKNIESLIQEIKKLPKNIFLNSDNSTSEMKAGRLTKTGEVYLKILEEGITFSMPQESKNIKYISDIIKSPFVPCITFEYQNSKYLVTGLNL